MSDPSSESSDTHCAPGSGLPDALRFNGGLKVREAAQWRERRDEIRELMLPVAYGNFPPTPGATRCVELHTAVARNLDHAKLGSYRIEVDGRHAFLLRVLVPNGSRPCPVILNGDGCWHYATDQVVQTILARGNGFAQFNRVEFAPDAHGAQQPPVQPHPAVAAWAWGYHRAVDALRQMAFIEGDCIAVVGHSRGGKAALLAGATDERIALTSANNSGAGGAGCFRFQGPGSETLADMVSAFPHWFSPNFNAFANREHKLPFDQHFLKALVAPRALLTTEALDDLWANPSGTLKTHLAAKEVYSLLGAPLRIVIAFREGGHDHSPADWDTLLDFADSVFHGTSFKLPPIPAQLLHPPAGPT